MGKFDGRTTEVKGFIIDPTTQSFDEFECTVPYTRTAEKAAKAVAEALGIEAPKIVSVSEVINTRVEYDNAKVYTHAVELYAADVDPALYADILIAEHKAINVRVKRYDCMGWAYNADTDEYDTVALTCETGGHIARGDVRAVMAMRYESDFTGWRIIATHGMQCREYKAVAIVPESDLEKCTK